MTLPGTSWLQAAVAWVLPHCQGASECSTAVLRRFEEQTAHARWRGRGASGAPVNATAWRTRTSAACCIPARGSPRQGYYAVSVVTDGQEDAAVGDGLLFHDKTSGGYLGAATVTLQQMPSPASPPSAPATQTRPAGKR